MLKEEQKRVRIPLLALLWGVMLLWAAGPCFATTTVIDTLLCQGAVFQHNGHHYSEPGVYYDTLVAADGQVHIDTLRLHAPVVTGATFLCFDAEDSLFAPLVADYYHWNTGDTTRGIRISEPGYYSVRLADGAGCFAATRVTQSYDPIRSIHLPAMCAGFPQPITIGYGDGYNVSLGRTDAHISRADTIFLPDGIDCGNGCSYISSVTFSGFPEYDTITSVNDILYVKLSIEHEWIGDLWIQLTCPNGQHTSILKKYPNSNGQTSSCSDSIPASEWHSYANYNYKFGVPNFINHDPICDASVNTIGICRDYCWSETDNQGYVYSPGSYVYATSNRTTEINNSLNNGHGWQQTLFCKPTNMANMSNVFRPDGSFSDLIGCPVNGEWKIEVMDGWSQHNGYLCGWELALADGMIYDGTVVNASSTSTGMLQIDSTTFVVMPPDTIHSDTTITYPLTLTDNHGCEYDTVLHILIHPLAQSSQSSEICQGDTLRYLGASLTSAGNYPFYFPGSNGCDSVAYLRLMVNPSPRTEIWDTVCDIRVWNGITYNNSGNYTQFFQTAHGCDSIVTLHLIVHHSTHTEWQDTVCDSLRWNDSLYITSGTYTQHFQTTHGCDSTVTLNLTVNHSAHTEWSQTVCDSLRWNDLLYTTSGDHTQHLFTTHGCDSTVVLHLTVNRSVATGWHDTVCDSLRWSDSLYTSSGLYTQHLQTIHGCDSTVTLLLTVNPSAHTEWSQTVCDSLRWNDVLYTTSGDHIQRLRTAHDCDSIVTLHLTVNRSAHTEWSRTVCDSLRWNDSLYTTSGDHIQHFQTSLGCDSTVTLRLTVNRSAQTEWSHTACDSLRWNGVLYTTSGDHTQHLLTEHSCDSTVTLHLTVNHSASSEWSQTVCDSLRWNGVLYTTSGNHIQHLQTATNCDSMVTLHLTVHHSAHTEWSQTVCDSLRWNDVLYTTSGDHTQHFQTAHGCDSAVTLHLTVHHSVAQERSATACDSLRWNDSLYTISGRYVQHFQTIHGCDSTVTLRLTVHYSADSTIAATVCDSLRWNDSLYTTSGIYTQHFRTIHGCDSTVTLHLTVHQSVAQERSSTVCDSLRWYDSLYTVTGDYTHHFQTVNGCDSAITLHLTVHQSVVQERSATVCDSLRWNDSLYTVSGIYKQHFHTVNGCDSTVTIDLTVHHSASTALTSTVCDSLRWNDSLYTLSGIYTQHLQTAHGCDSTVTLALTVLTSPRSTLYDTIVENALPYDTLGLHFTASGVQSAAIPSASGCDSLVTVVLEVLPNTYLSYDTAVCASALPLAWRGHLFTAAGEWRDTLANPNGTSCYVSATLTQYPQPVLSITGITHPGCYGTTTGSLTATVTGGTPPYSFQWQEANQTTPLHTATSTASNLPAGAYWAQVTDAHQCSAADSASLHYLYGEMTPGQISANQEVCEGNIAAPLTGSAASGGSNSSYQWQVSYNGTTFSPAPGTNNTQNFTPDTVTQWRMYRRAWISALCGTQYSNAVTVQSMPTPRDTIHATVCQDHAFDSLAFHVNAFDTHLPGTIVRINRAQTIYQCDSIVTLLLTVLPSAHDTLHDEVCQNNPYEANGFQIPSDSTSAPGTRIYQRQLVQTDCGCDSIVTLILTVNPTYRIEIQDHICEGDGYSQHGFRLSAGETIGADHLQRRQELHTQLGCDSIIILDLDITDTALTIDTYPYDFCEEYELTLTASSPLGNYLWNNGESSASVEVHTPGYYSVTASDGDCSATAGISIQPCDMTLFLPNAISPSNHDGLNDDFHLEAGYQRQITDFSIRIFDRWGNLVFASTDKNFRWQGEQNGTIIPNTTYNYVIKYRDLYGEEFTAKGTIIVL